MASPVLIRPPRARLARAAGVAPLLAAALSGCHQASHPAPAMVPASLHYLTRAEWGANPPVLPMREHQVRRITIHHTATAQAPQRAAADKLRALQRFSQRDDSLAGGGRKPAWPDVPYHFYVAADGTVAEGREWRYVGDSNTPYDPTGHLLIVVEGSFDADTLATAQRHALETLVPALARHFRLAPSALAAHKDFAATRCPGATLYAELPHLRALIRELP